MADYYEYLTWRGDLPFETVPFNEVDSAILAEISYFPYDLLGIRADTVTTLQDAVEALLQVPDLEEKIPRHHWKLLQALPGCDRFLHLPVLQFRNIFDESHVVQFAVITIQLKEELYYVSFRGTNHTLTGWQEDFNMAIEFPVPAQKLAAIYLNGLGEKLRGDFLVGGHSKGGNLAVYAGAFCNPELKSRIRTIYNFDGPGFESWVMSQPEYLQIADRIHTFVPQSSIIGMLLEQAEGYQVVHSTESGGMAQHRMQSWEIKRDHFVKLESVTNKSLFMDSAITEWIHSMDYSRRKAFVEVLFRLLKDADIKAVSDISPKKIGQMMSMVKVLAGMDPEVRNQMTSAIMALIRCAREEAPAFGMGGVRLFMKRYSEKTGTDDSSE